MLVLPSPKIILKDHYEFHRFLLDFQQNLPLHESPKILSITQEIDPIDPLHALARFSRTDQLHFYCEKPELGEAIAAFDAVLHFTGDGKNRFFQSLEFIRKWQKQIVRVGSFKSSAAPHFCCSFTFFEDNDQFDHSLHQPQFQYCNAYSSLTDEQCSHFPVGNFSPASLFLPALQILKQGEDYFLTLNLALNPQLDIETTALQLWDKINQIRFMTREAFVLTQHRKLSENLTRLSPQQGESFQGAVRSALGLIGSKTLDKIVLAQAIDVQGPQPFNLTHSLANLRLLYPDCCIFSTSNGQGQTFIGASPERLVAVHNQELITDALAGSAPRGRTATEDTRFVNQLLCSEKDRWEHQVVVDFITQSLRELGLDPQRSPHPCLMQLSNIQHLWTPIKAHLSRDIHLLEILAKLHPTPAAAGNSREIAQIQIRRYESFNRLLYAAPIGWINADGNGEFIVGIRSALIQGNCARLFAGAGIVAGSEPAKEFAEIQLKFQALLKALV
ncbi:MAG: isochorismate synthase [Microcoleaceae cyanobacterium]